MASEYKKIFVVIMGLAILKLAFFAFEEKFGAIFTNQFFSSVISAENISSLINNARIEAKKKSLKISTVLTAAAQKKAENMAEERYFAHTSPSGKTPWDFMDDAGYNYLYAGENLAIDFDNAGDIINAMMKSKLHRENILSANFTELGIGIKRGVVVQMFGKPLKGRAFGSAAVTSTSELLINPTTGMDLFDQLYLIISLFGIGMILFWLRRACKKQKLV